MAVDTYAKRRRMQDSTCLLLGQQLAGSVHDAACRGGRPRHRRAFIQLGRPDPVLHHIFLLGHVWDHLTISAADCLSKFRSDSIYRYLCGLAPLPELATAILLLCRNSIELLRPDRPNTSKAQSLSSYRVSYIYILCRTNI